MGDTAVDLVITENPLRDDRAVAEPSRAPLALHRAIPGFVATPTRRAPDLADRWGVAEVWLKDETERFGLPSFKIVGALWAVHRLLCDRLALPAEETSYAELTDRLRGSDLGLLTASAGNWGRAVARTARVLSLRATILLPETTAAARIQAIEQEGAVVEVVPGNFDDAVASAAARADRHNLLVADASADPDEPFPHWVSQGYETFFAEIDDALAAAGADTPNLVVVPVGAGALAAAAARHYARTAGTYLLGVEPHEAASTMASARAGRILTLPAQSPTPMAGMNCGTPSATAWPDVSAGFDAFCSIADATAEHGMRILARAGISAGACSGSGVGTAEELLAGDRQETRLKAGLHARSSVLLLLTEGVTDPAHHSAVLAGGAAQR